MPARARGPVPHRWWNAILHEVPRGFRFLAANHDLTTWELVSVTLHKRTDPSQVGLARKRGQSGISGAVTRGRLSHEKYPLRPHLPVRNRNGERRSGPAWLIACPPAGSPSRSMSRWVSFARSDGRVFAAERLPGRHLAGQWEFPGRQDSSRARARAPPSDASSGRRWGSKWSRPARSSGSPASTRTAGCGSRCSRSPNGGAGRTAGRVRPSTGWSRGSCGGSISSPERSPSSPPSSSRPLSHHPGAEGGQFRGDPPRPDRGGGPARAAPREVDAGGRPRPACPPGGGARRTERGAGLPERGPGDGARRRGPRGAPLEPGARAPRRTPGGSAGVARVRGSPPRATTQASSPSPDRSGCDFAVLSPVWSTPGHPDAQPIGWEGFARLVEPVDFPVFALGGLGPGDRAAAVGRRRPGDRGDPGSLEPGMTGHSGYNRAPFSPLPPERRPA